MSASYATLTDLYTYGLSLAACGNVTTTQQQQLLDSASETAESYMSARYAMPILTPYPHDLIEKVCHLAAWNILNLRGFNPAAAADINIRDRMVMATAWLEGVERQRIHPKVVESIAPSPGFPSPLIVSQPLQGWQRRS